jgi:hypothetical protein
MDLYGGAVKRQAEKHACVFVDLQSGFDEYLKHYSAQSVTWDRIHPDIVGHMIIARAFLRAAGFEWK